MEIVPWVIGGVVALVLLWLVGNYNHFVRLQHHIRESWSGIDVELKRRYELIPNLVATVKGYVRHEREVLEEVVALRNRAQASHGSPGSQARDEADLLRGLKQLFVVTEAYPQLRSDQHFLGLQKELALTEDRIAAARRFYNANVRDMRQRCEMFPTALLARFFGFSAPEFFELDSALERVVPRADLG
ncbi:MAG: LemA family protein [Planctomycetes bacterium]|nr:LemA family protein [Planctomycetota bacterium]